jgi:hypothetical protein
MLARKLINVAKVAAIRPEGARESISKGFICSAADIIEASIKTDF